MSEEGVIRYLILIAYLRMKTGERDWHAVGDAANDLREMEAKNPELRTVNGEATITRSR